MTSSNVDEDLMPTFEQMVAFYTAHIAECLHVSQSADGQERFQRGDASAKGDQDFIPRPIASGNQTIETALGDDLHHHHEAGRGYTAMV